MKPVLFPLISVFKVSFVNIWLAKGVLKTSRLQSHISGDKKEMIVFRLPFLKHFWSWLSISPQFSCWWISWTDSMNKPCWRSQVRFVTSPRWSTSTNQVDHYDQSGQKQVNLTKHLEQRMTIDDQLELAREHHSILLPTVNTISWEFITILCFVDLVANLYEMLLPHRWLCLGVRLGERTFMLTYIFIWFTSYKFI